jgi:hypothetical protein
MPGLVANISTFRLRASAWRSISLPPLTRQLRSAIVPLGRRGSSSLATPNWSGQLSSAANSVVLKASTGTLPQRAFVARSSAMRGAEGAETVPSKATSSIRPT